ncbi:hypothetical protein RRG08_014568 [Elysia crispata]|uniref:Uncharacterized protein n=1 Tax=Elysia crispata TaxID=231223 RepID=A0AAE1ATG6_9GAST|nr:hypothetical protein RRG08_014568 [Elysia crispata]
MGQTVKTTKAEIADADAACAQSRHCEFSINKLNYLDRELSARIQYLMRNGLQDERITGQYHGKTEVFTPQQCTEKTHIAFISGRDIDYNWRLCVPQFYFGYTPKDAAVCKEDFKERWINNQYAAWNHLGRHMYNLLRTP